MATSKKLAKAAAAAPGARKKPQESAAKTKAVLTAGKKKETIPYAVRLDPDVFKRWKFYTDVKGYKNKGKETEAALTEYMNRHKLTDAEISEYDERHKRPDMM